MKDLPKDVHRFRMEKVSWGRLRRKTCFAWDDISIVEQAVLIPAEEAVPIVLILRRNTKEKFPRPPAVFV